VAPPTIVVKCNDPELFDESWKRYLLGFLREVSPFQEVPIRMIMRARGGNEESLNLPDIELRNEITDADFQNDFPEDELFFDENTVDDDFEDDDSSSFMDDDSDDDDDDDHRPLRFDDSDVDSETVEEDMLE